jgi:glutamine amidotransferase
MNIVIIDYEMGNLRSVQKAIEKMGGSAVISSDLKVIEKASKLILPGVGAFGKAMQNLQKMGLIDIIKSKVKEKTPLLGICLGYQILFDKGFEKGEHQGLGLISGQIELLTTNKNLKVPHMGWNQIKVRNKNSKLFKNISNQAYFYFVHSYYSNKVSKEVSAANVEYGSEFVCAIEKDNLFGVQFHPEKSADAGLKIIKNFIELGA